SPLKLGGFQLVLSIEGFPRFLPTAVGVASAGASEEKTMRSRLGLFFCLGGLAAIGAAAAGSAAHSAPAARVPSGLQGRWSQTHSCAQLVAALRSAGLGRAAPAIVGDYFPHSTPKQLAQKTDICSGATPQVHSHFFTAAGAFGSVDQHSQQVDDGSYTIL